MEISLEDLFKEEPKPDPNQNLPGHFMEFYGFNEDDDCYDFDIEHPPGCPTYELYSGVNAYSCNVGEELLNCGDMAFGVWDNELSHLSPGRYEIEWWMEVHRTWESTEYSSGLTIKD